MPLTASDAAFNVSYASVGLFNCGLVLGTLGFCLVHAMIYHYENVIDTHCKVVEQLTRACR